MADKHLHQLTDRQLEVMDVLWSRGSATAGEVHTALARTRLARKTIGTLLFRLEKQGLVDFTVEGREHVYRATVTREEVGRASLGNLLSRVFGGSLPSLVQHALQAEEVEEGDVERVRAMLERWPAEREGEP